MLFGDLPFILRSTMKYMNIYVNHQYNPS